MKKKYRFFIENIMKFYQLLIEAVIYLKIRTTSI